MESKRLMIRQSNVEDCELFAKWEAKDEVAYWFTYNQESRNYTEVLKEFVIQSLDASKMQYTIVEKTTDQPIGRVYISHIDQHADSLDLTRIYIGESEKRGKGFGEEAIRLFLDYCFINLHTERITLDHIKENLVGAALYSKLGFQYEGIARHAGKKDGKYIDLHQMSILRAEYYQSLHEDQF